MRWLLAALLVLASGCARAEDRSPPATPALPAPAETRVMASAGDASSTPPDGSICELDPSACPRPGEVQALAERTVTADAYAVKQTGSSVRGALTNGLTTAFGGGGGAAPAPTTATLPAPADTPRSREMLEIEARFAIECESVAAAATKLRESVSALGGAVTVDQSETQHRSASATLEIRIPVRDYDRLVVDLNGLGTIRTREVKAKDVAKDYHDAQLLLSNLEAAMQRYEQLLAKASTVTEVLAIERELERLRARIDRVKGDLDWMKDRVARATIRVRLFPVPSAEDIPLATRSAFYPSLRAAMLFDVRGESDRYGYAGGGLGVAWHGESSNPRALVVELDVARHAFTDRPPGSRYTYLGLAGVDLYSDMLGGGRRRLFNPYIGLRTGYVQSEGSGDFALGGLLGADLWKSKNAILELGIRALTLLGNDRGAHLMLGPHLAFDFAF